MFTIWYKYGMAPGPQVFSARIDSDRGPPQIQSGYGSWIPDDGVKALHPPRLCRSSLDQRVGQKAIQKRLKLNSR